MYLHTAKAAHGGTDGFEIELSGRLTDDLSASISFSNLRGPVEQAVAQLEGHNSGIMERFSGGGQEVDLSESDQASASGYKGSRGLDPEVVEEIKKQFGFDKFSFTASFQY